MKAVEFYTFMLPPSPWSKKPYPSRWKMTIEQAAARHPGATPILASKEVHMCPETPEDFEAKQMTANPRPLPKRLG